ncbi:hypothetical protein [Singulisphaera acidiphila]|uniref:Uncharacterized protein n=1 Tax=Singulisphaera acidiphila (strain ATCC BAA-1392 / DSM 18658 / VKM B-2454 / MOB10) TaxID=886293 RepID=L0D803_SINAD|nr:hypothetical protein [Singulisphaera acidiphila]AGA24781.1 hypothetical protein Sinac_0338 [Singulisphaera acidiphila DSM 18658]
MNNKVLRCEGFSIAVAEGWDDITETLDDADAPLTIADPTSGVGALQFSPAIYKGGRLPQVGPQDLSELLEEFASKQDWDAPFDRSTYPGEVAIEGVSFQVGDDFIRMWYASDGKNVMLATYVCDWNCRDQELSEREMAVRSIQFDE